MHMFVCALATFFSVPYYYGKNIISQIGVASIHYIYFILYICMYSIPPPLKTSRSRLKATTKLIKFNTCSGYEKFHCSVCGASTF